jgi:hypothetical protein
MELPLAGREREVLPDGVKVWLLLEVVEQAAPEYLWVKAPFGGFSSFGSDVGNLSAKVGHRHGFGEFDFGEQL